MGLIVFIASLVTHTLCYLMGRATILNRELEKHYPKIKIEREDKDLNDNWRALIDTAKGENKK